VGIHNFFATHKCTEVCKTLGIDKKCPHLGGLRPTKAIVQHSSSYRDEEVKKANRFVPKLEVIQE
jgi:hypothetical protein